VRKSNRKNRMMKIKTQTLTKAKVKRRQGLLGNPTGNPKILSYLELGRYVFVILMFSICLEVMQGTTPFIAIKLLIHGSIHRVAHDMESVLYVLLFICSHLEGPCGAIRDPPLYGNTGSADKVHPSSIVK
jgi:Fungal protein kinase